MTYYSGASLANYIYCDSIQQKYDHHIPREIHCQDSNINGSAIFQVVGFAYKRARQDQSRPIVIEITRESDFKVTHPDGYPLLKGLLNPENHIVHIFLEELVRR